MLFLVLPRAENKHSHFFFCIARDRPLFYGFYKNFDKIRIISQYCLWYDTSRCYRGICGIEFFHNHVRDFIDVHLGMGYHWPTFNIADSLICVGVGLIFYETLFTKKKGQGMLLTRKSDFVSFLIIFLID